MTDIFARQDWTFLCAPRKTDWPNPRLALLARAVLKAQAMKVLIADDCASVRFALRLVLEYWGHDVVGQAASGTEMLELYRHCHPEVVLMDVRMPGPDGLACTSRLAALDPNARVVIVTAGRTTEREARQAGAAGYIEKPFAIEQLQWAVQAALRAPRTCAPARGTVESAPDETQTPQDG